MITGVSCQMCRPISNERKKLMDKLDKILTRTAGMGLMVTIVLYLFTFIPLILAPGSFFMFLGMVLTILSLIITVIAGIILATRFLLEVTK